MDSKTSLQEIVESVRTEHLETLEKFEEISKILSRRMMESIRERLSIEDVALFLYFVPQDTRIAYINTLPKEDAFLVVDQFIQYGTASYIIDMKRAKRIYERIYDLCSSGRMVVDCASTIAGILLGADRETYKYIMEKFGEVCPELANEIEEESFTFDDLDCISDGLMDVLGEIELEEFGLALTGVRESIVDLVRNCYDPEKREILDTRRQRYSSPMDVKAAQQTILDVVKRLEECGRVLINYQKLIDKRRELLKEQQLKLTGRG